MNRICFAFAALLLTLVVFAFVGIQPARGQADTGTISGVVRDASGAVLPNATVAAKNSATASSRTVQSAADGGYNIPSLPPGIYDVSVTASGFQPFNGKAQVTVGSHVTLDAQLSVSNQTETVEVVAEGGAEVNTQTQEISQAITPQQIQELPSLTRNPYDFVALAGNVSSGDRGMASSNGQVGGAAQNGYDRGVGFSINGQRASGTEILLDGAENINIFNTSVALYIPQDAVAEYRVITNNFDAQYGRAAGGVVNLVSKSGSNNFHGDAWEFNRLSAYTANTYDNVANDVPKSVYTRNDFGYAVGGPVIKNKLFFFQSTEWLRVRSGANLIGLIPTPQLIAASAANTQAFFNAFGKGPSFSSTVNKPAAPSSTFNFTPGGLFDTAVPAGTPVFGVVHFTAPADAGGDEPQNTYDLVGRVDYDLNATTQLSFRYGREHLTEASGAEFNSPYSQYDVGLGLYNNNFMLSVSHNFTTNLISNTKLSYFRYNNPFTYNSALQNVPTMFLFNNATQGGTPINLPGFFDATTGTGGLPSGGPQNTVMIGDDLVWAKGAHTIRFGGQYNYNQMNQAFAAYAQANEQIGTNLAKGLDGFIAGTLTNFQAAINPAGHFGCAAGSYTSGGGRGPLIPTPACTLTLPVTPAPFERSDRYNDWALYLEDSWRIKPKLTINYGTRYEHYGVQHNNHAALDSNFYYGSGSSYFQQVQNGHILTVPNSPIGGLWSPRWGTIAPRVGFAYDLFGDGKTALRGGFGISYERNFGNVTFNVIQNPPNYQVVTISQTVITNSNSGPLSGSSGSAPIPTGSARNVDQNINVAQTQFWGLSIDHQLGTAGVVSVEYNGAHGVHLYDIKNINEVGGGQAYLGQPQPTDCSTAPDCFTRPNQSFTNINNRGSEGFSHYNALNLRYQTQDLRHSGVSLVANYTWAHSLDNLSTTFSETSSGSNGVGNLGYLDPRNPALDYGNSDYDIRNRIALAPIWATPWFKSGKGWERQALGGYTWVAVFTARGGVPFNVSDSTNSLNANTGPYGIPRYTPAVPSALKTMSTGGAVSLLGPNSFDLLNLPVANDFVGFDGVSDFGPYPATMMHRNAFRGPGAWTFDLSLSKDFALTERFKLEFRAEGFNILNHHNMYVDGYDLDASNFVGRPVVIDGKKGGLANLAFQGNHDERRFGQFALRLLF